ncbi:shikimate dehydrogenase [Arenibacter sp. 6A1]|uniref:shikimate dehydrogenase family protein n=1 Tax=Arenibacter sp. 6A1 TaxID=2720391 RepID=UPI0014453CFD|nr:shikimate dehydrogenase [Arenibacter sp. 6A1]NKI27683.1 shikimate dehydrogenase [Arenibacter sp. 6A1]
MEITEKKKFRFGLIGKNISYSFSKGYFTNKFSKMGLDTHSYENFDLEEITEFTNLLKDNNNIVGFNVTIPYKEQIMPLLTKIQPEAQKIGAVNTIKVIGNNTYGYNTDAHGFQQSIAPHLKAHHSKALILGTGGASKAVAHVFAELGIRYKFVSRNPAEGQLQYRDLNRDIMDNYSVIVNCTPLGTFPNIEDKPTIPYSLITEKHLLYDLIYNPEKTAFLLAGEAQGAQICNGANMLELQAEKAWSIWNSNEEL